MAHGARHPGVRLLTPSGDREVEADAPLPLASGFRGVVVREDRLAPQGTARLDRLLRVQNGLVGRHGPADRLGERDLHHASRGIFAPHHGAETDCPAARRTVVHRQCEQGRTGRRGVDAGPRLAARLEGRGVCGRRGDDCGRGNRGTGDACADDAAGVGGHGHITTSLGLSGVQRHRYLSEQGS